MKNLTCGFGSFLTVFLLVHVAGAGVCGDRVRDVLEAQAKVDFPDSDPLAVLPAFRDDGGSVYRFDVPIISGQDSNRVIAIYDVSFDETCSVQILEKK